MVKGMTVRMWRRTILAAILLIVFGFGVVTYSLIKLQLIDGPSLQMKAADQQLRDTQLMAKRGTIYDCNMKELAKSATVWDVVLVPAQVAEKQRNTIAAGLAKILGMDQNDILTRSKKKKSYYDVLKTKVESEVRDQILSFEEKNKITGGIRLVENYKRYYPYGQFAATVLGFTGTDSQGLAGVEAEYDSELTGTNGRLVTAQNAVGTDMGFQYEQEVPAKDGDGLVLTINEVVQHYVEKYLAEGVADNNVQNRGCAIVMNPKTGAILAMAVKGDFDPNNPFKIADSATAAAISKITDSAKKTEETQKALNAQWRNKCINDTYTPGSVFKMVTASAALEENLVTENTTFNCPGYLTIMGNPIHDWKTFGSLTFEGGICNSSNVVFMQVGALLGIPRFFKYFQDFGLTEKTGVDLPGESRSIYHTPESMTALDLAVCSFGQSNKITPIQMITAACAIANGGYLVQPHVVDKVLDGNGNIVRTTSTAPKRQIISADTAKRMRTILQKDATSGTAKSGYIAGYRVAGKTGTSEKIEMLPQKEYIASYCGFAPADNPQAIMLVFYDQPHGPNGYYGSPVAGPTFLASMTQILPYLGVEPQYSQNELEKLDGTAPETIGMKPADAKNTVTKAGLAAKTYGSGDKVVSQVPEPGKQIPKSGTVVLLTDDASVKQTVTVPDLTKLSLSAANEKAAAANVNISVKGAALTSSSAVSSSQDLAAGTKVPPGTVVTVSFSDKNEVF